MDLHLYSRQESMETPETPEFRRSGDNGCNELIGSYPVAGCLGLYGAEVLSLAPLLYSIGVLVQQCKS